VARCVSLAAWRGLPLRFYVLCGAIRLALTHFTPVQMQWLSPTTIQTYRSWMADKLAVATRAQDTFVTQRLKEDIEVLPDGRSSIMWVGDRHRASRFVLFFHGGAYVASMTEAHLEWCYQAYVKASPDVEVAVALLQYTLVPQTQYPTHLQQAVAALQHLLNSGIDPGQMVVGGDSAGGNLTAQLLGHILHPHPRVDPVHLTKPLLAAFAVSPWVSTRTSYQSFRENGNIDMLDPSTIQDKTLRLLGGTGYEAEEREDKGWAMPVDADVSWFQGLGKATASLYVTVGKHEILRDQGLAFAESIRRGNADVLVRVEVGEKEPHDNILLEHMLKMFGTAPVDATMRMKDWFLEVIRSKH
jgi:acetyl esterase/lipase